MYSPLHAGPVRPLPLHSGLHVPCPPSSGTKRPSPFMADPNDPSSLHSGPSSPSPSPVPCAPGTGKRWPPSPDGGRSALPLQTAPRITEPNTCNTYVLRHLQHTYRIRTCATTYKHFYLFCQIQIKANNKTEWNQDCSCKMSKRFTN